MSFSQWGPSLGCPACCYCRVHLALPHPAAPHAAPSGMPSITTALPYDCMHLLKCTALNWSACSLVDRQAREIARTTKQALLSGQYDFVRCNFANPGALCRGRSLPHAGWRCKLHPPCELRLHRAACHLGTRYRRCGLVRRCSFRK